MLGWVARNVKNQGISKTSRSQTNTHDYKDYIHIVQ